MSVIPFFPKPDRDREHDHAEDSPESKSPDAAELQRLLGPILATIHPRPVQRNEQEIRIRNFRSDQWELTDDLIVLLEDRAGQYIANSYDTGQYGHGYSPDAAIYDLCSVLEDYYDLLIEDEGHLSPPLQAHLRYLRAILRARG